MNPLPAPLTPAMGPLSRRDLDSQTCFDLPYWSILELSCRLYLNLLKS